VYPVAAKAESFLIHRDGQTRTRIEVQVADWKNVTARTSAGRPCACSWQRHVYEFVIEPGENYELH
jgi:hypothetical protein